MAISRKRKEALVAEYVDMLKQANGVVVTEYRGMTMKHLDELRGKLREKNAGFTITRGGAFFLLVAHLGPVPYLQGDIPVGRGPGIELFQGVFLGVQAHSPCAE